MYLKNKKHSKINLVTLTCATKQPKVTVSNEIQCDLAVFKGLNT